MRRHQATLGKLGDAPEDTSTSKASTSRAAQRIYGLGGVYEKILRREYMDGLQKLNTNSFESKAEKEEWEKFRDKLSPDELALVTKVNWQ